MGDSSRRAGNHVVEVVGKVMVVGILLLFFVVTYFIGLILYLRWCNLHRHQEITATDNGLDPCIMKSIPVVVFNPNEFMDGSECAVCLCEVCECENVRILPKCSHGFHVECIDMWFQSHASCPLCRTSVWDQKSSDSESTLHDLDYASSDGPNLPSSIWGDVSSLGSCVAEDQSSTSATTTRSNPHGNGMVVIDVIV